MFEAALCELKQLVGAQRQFLAIPVFHAALAARQSARLAGQGEAAAGEPNSWSELDHVGLLASGQSQAGGGRGETRRKYASFRGATVAKSPVTGESAKETVKTIARGMPGDPV
jgi:hypothetical protein